MEECKVYDIIIEFVKAYNNKEGEHKHFFKGEYKGKKCGFGILNICSINF
jgi:hypothetical protein